MMRGCMTSTSHGHVLLRKSNNLTDMNKYYDINVYTIGEIISMVLGENEK